MDRQRQLQPIQQKEKRNNRLAIDTQHGHVNNLRSAVLVQSATGF